MRRQAINRISKAEIKTEILSFKTNHEDFNEHDWLQQISSLINIDKFKTKINVSNEKIILYKGKNLYSWGIQDKQYFNKQEKFEIEDILCLDSRCFILDKEKKVYKQNEKQIYNQNIKALRKFQGAMIFITQDNQLIDEKQNKLKQNVEDVQTSQEFLVLQTKNQIQIAGNFPYQQSFDLKISKISCGFNHIMCLSIDSQLFIWGDGSMGQIGNNFNKTQHSPQLVMTNVQDIAAGFESSMILKGNNIYTCGTNQIHKKQNSFIKLKSDHIYIQLFSSWSIVADIQYAYYVYMNDDLVNELNNIIQQIEDDDLLLPDETLAQTQIQNRQQVNQNINDSLLNRKPQIFGQNNRQNNLNQNKSKTPQKKLKFIQD